MELVASKAPYQRSKRTTTQIMIELLIGLGVIFVASIVHYFTVGVWYGVKALAMMGVSILVTLLCDVLVACMRFKGEKKELGEHIIKEVMTNYSVITAVIFTLTLPIGTPFYVLIVGNIFATLIVKYAFGGFGQNIFNPAALARLFVALAFGSTLLPYLGETPSNVAIQNGGILAGATLTSQYSALGPKWLGDPSQFDLLRVFVGNYNGALGETFAFLIIVVGVVLAIREVINWRTPVFYIGTLALTAIPMALFAGINVFESIALSIGLGGALFGAVFMLTDPVSSPTSNFGKSLIGILAAFMTVLIRVAGSYPEGVAFSIAFVNILSPMIDKLVSGQTTTMLWKKYVTSGAILAISVGAMSLVSYNKTRVAGDDDSSSSEEPVVIVPDYVLTGSYTSVEPVEEYADPFTTTVNVGLDLAYNIVTLEVIDGSTPNFGGYKNKAQQFVDYYTSIDVKTFLDLPVITEVNAGVTKPEELEAPQVVKGLWYSSVAIYQAIADAFSGISYYDGSHKSALCDPTEEYCDYGDATLDVTVYVKSDKIQAVALGEEGRSTPSFANRFEGKLPSILEKFYDLEVNTLLAMTDPVQLFTDDTTNVVAGLTFSANRLFLAVQNALEGYGK